MKIDNYIVLNLQQLWNEVESQYFLKKRAAPRTELLLRKAAKEIETISIKRTYYTHKGVSN